jgi:hypothetical protein
VQVRHAVADDDLPTLERTEAGHRLADAERQRELAEPFHSQRAGDDRQIDKAERRADALAAEHPAGVEQDVAQRCLTAGW